MKIRKTQTHQWGVRYMLPKDEAKGRRWPKNGSCTCICDTLEQAATMLREVHPDVTILAINHHGNGDTYAEDRHAVLVAEVTP